MSQTGEGACRTITDGRHRIRESIMGSAQLHVALRTSVRIPLQLMSSANWKRYGNWGSKCDRTTLAEACTSVKFSLSRRLNR